jgi:transposase
MAELTRYEAARRALAAASNVDEVKDIRDKAVALREYARRANNTEMEEQCVRIRLHSEKRLGEMMAEQKASGRMAVGAKGVGPIAGYQKSHNAPPTLAQSGVDKNLAIRARTARKLTDAEIDARAANETRAAKRDAAGRHAAELRRKGMSKKEAAKTAGVSSDTVARKHMNYDAGFQDGLKAQTKQGEIAHAKAENAEVQLLREGLKNTKATIAILNRQIAKLEAELKLPPEATKRLQAMLRRFRSKDRVILNAKTKAGEVHRREEIANARRAYGCVDDKVMDLWQACMHPDGNPSEKTKNNAFRELTSRKSALLGKKERGRLN